MIHPLFHPLFHPLISSVDFTNFPPFSGARQVVAVEADAEMAELAQQVVDANGLDVVVLQGRVEVTKWVDLVEDKT